MADKNKGEFDKARKGGMGGDKKQRANRNTTSRTGHKQNSGGGGRR